VTEEPVNVKEVTHNVENLQPLGNLAVLKRFRNANCVLPLKILDSS